MANHVHVSPIFVVPEVTWSRVDTLSKVLVHGMLLVVTVLVALLCYKMHRKPLRNPFWPPKHATNVTCDSGKVSVNGTVVHEGVSCEELAALRENEKKDHISKSDGQPKR